MNGHIQVRDNLRCPFLPSVFEAGLCFFVMCASLEQTAILLSSLPISLRCTGIIGTCLCLGSGDGNSG